MTMIAIVPETAGFPDTQYRAIAEGKFSVGATTGQALDALNAQLDPEDKKTLVIVQTFEPDHFFTAQQQQRLQALMQRWRQARDARTTLPMEEQAELDSLIEAEVRAAADRAQALTRERQK